MHTISHAYLAQRNEFDLRPRRKHSAEDLCSDMLGEWINMQYTCPNHNLWTTHAQHVEIQVIVITACLLCGLMQSQWMIADDKIEYYFTHICINIVVYQKSEQCLNLTTHPGHKIFIHMGLWVFWDFLPQSRPGYTIGTFCNNRSKYEAEAHFG